MTPEGWDAIFPSVFGFEIPSLKVLLIIILVCEVFIGWIPWFLAYHAGARQVTLIGLCGLLSAPLPPVFLGALFWALVAPSREPCGRGLQVIVKNGGGAD